MAEETRITRQADRRVKGRIDHQAVASIAETLMNETTAEAVVLFGSRAKGTEDEDSDYDLCLIMPDDTPHRSVDLARLWTLIKDRGVLVDLIAMTRSRYFKGEREINSVAQEVWRTGAIVAGTIPEPALA